MWTPRTTPVTEGEKPFAWGVESVYQCTWFCYFESAFHSLSYPCYWDRATKTGSYTNAKDWLKEYRDPWIPIYDKDYVPVAGDILVYDGEYGHVIFCETDVMTTEYRNGDPDSFRVGKVGDYNGTLLGVLHYPYEPCLPVERDEMRNQIQTTDDSLRIRSKPSLDAEIVGHVQLGFYNVFDTKENDGYTWYQISKGRWCANVSTIYLPANDDDFMKEIERVWNATKSKIKGLEKETKDMKEDFNSIQKIAEKWNVNG